MNVTLTEGGRIVFRFLIFLGLVSGLAMGCALLEPSPTSPPRPDTAVPVPVGDTGTAVAVVGTGEERPSTLLDDSIDTVAAVGSAIVPNPLLWGLVAQLAHLGVGAIAGRKKKTAAPA